MRRFLVPVIAIAAALVVGTAAYVAVRSQNPATAAPTGSTCSGRPCADAGGYRMTVDGVRRQAGIVRLQVSFKVDGRDHMHAVPADFSLRAGGKTYEPYFLARVGCAAWPRTPIADGGSLGPEAVCFKVPSTAGRLTLNWDPDLGILEYFSSGYDLPLS
ncbi:MAG: hypothetical protein ACREQM_17515 [Candidatus Dormibacteraceae bacterium]